MSWVTDVVLFYSAWEQEVGEISPCLSGINNWLAENEQVPLLDFAVCANTGDRKFMQAEVWGGAFNHLDIEDFLECVKEQPWHKPERVQVMVKDEEEDTFTLYGISDII
jgi:hypothetical protein